MALIMNDLEMYVELSASEMADVNGGWYDEYKYKYQPVGVADALSGATALGVHSAFTFTDTFAEVGPGYAIAASSSQSSAN